MAAHLHPNHSSILESSHNLLSWRCRKYRYIGVSERRSSKFPFHDVGLVSGARRLKTRKALVHCCSSSTSSSVDQEVDLASGKLELEQIYKNKKVELGFLTRENNWQVRRMVETEEEMREVANIQARAFHEPVILFNDIFFDFFQAEVLSGLLYRLRNSPPDRYACLVAEPINDAPNSKQQLVGVVDVTAHREQSVLQHLPGAEEYLYVSGIAVLNEFRRQKVATALLKACDALAIMWGFKYLALRAYEDDLGAQKLYSRRGYRVVSGDPPWITSWIGRRRRVLMIKKPGQII